MNDIDVSPLFNKLSLALYKDSIERMKASGNFYNNVHVDLKSIDNETWLSKILKYIFHKPMNNIKYITVYVDYVEYKKIAYDYKSMIDLNVEITETILSIIFGDDIYEKLKEYNYDFNHHNFKSNYDTECFYDEVLMPELVIKQLRKSA